jgi:hypothetical protein
MIKDEQAGVLYRQFLKIANFFDSKLKLKQSKRKNPKKEHLPYPYLGNYSKNPCR